MALLIRHFCRFARQRSSLAIFAFLFVSLVSLTLASQTFAEDSFQRSAYDAVNAEQISADDLPKFKKYISETELDAQIFGRKDVQNIAAARLKFLQTYFAPKKGGQPREVLLQLSLDAVKGALSGNTSEIVKLNAVLFAGELTEVTGPDFYSAIKANPPHFSESSKLSAKGLEILVAVLASDRSSEVLKDAALVGIKRHAESHREATAPRGSAKSGFAMDANSLKAVSRECLKMLQDALKAVSSATDGQQILARKACEVLATIGDAGPQDQNLAAVYEAVNSTNLRLPIRAGIAQYAGEFVFTDKSKPLVNQMAQAVLDLAKASCQEELDVSKKLGAQPDPKRMYLRLQPLADFFGNANGKVLRLQGIVAASAKTGQKTAVIATAKSFNEIFDYLTDPAFRKSKLIEMIGPPKSANPPVAERSK